MAPKSSQRTSQPQPFQAAVTKLCNAIDDAKGKKGEIKAPSIVNKLKEYIANFRKAKKVLGSEIINLVVGCLENDGKNICSRLDPAIFCTVVELVMQTEPCIEGERSLFLLAESLFHDAQDPKRRKPTERRKETIGQECRLQLLGYFIDEETAPTVRRWAGVLCVQLFSDCEENCRWMELGPEDYRREIGRAVTQEPDEILRIIYGQLLRTLLKGNIPLQEMFPVDCEEELYTNFPASTQDKTGWGGAFQTYVDDLFGKGLAPIPSNGTLHFATTIAMRPEREFGAQGHTKYVFLHEVQGNSPELSIFAPAQSGMFDRILDIPLHSITSLSIVTDEYSQVASELHLELKDGKGLEFFLDSEKVQLNTIHLTFQPHHVQAFKNDLVCRCPDIIVAQSDKATALKPTSSDSQQRTSQSDEIHVGSSASMPKLKDFSSRKFDGTRMRKNSIPETQEGHNDVQRSIDGKDEQNSINANEPQDEHDDEATPQTTNEQVKVTPASRVSGDKSIAPPKSLKGGVKPKAKPPIIQRDLLHKLSQASTQEPVAAAGGRSRIKQKQSELAIAAEQASQGANGKQKQSGPASIAQLPSVSQGKKGTTDSAAKMPPPKSKATGKTRSTRSSQVAGEDADRQVSDEHKPLPGGSEKSSIDVHKPSTSVSKISANHEVSTDKNKSGVNATTKSLQARKKPENQDFSDDFITDVDGMDASTPKVTGVGSQMRKQTTAASTSNTQTNKLSDTASTTTRKRYSLYPRAKNTPSVLDTYDIPVDDDEEVTSKKAKIKKGTKARKSASSAATSGKTTNKTATKADPKKRQSAPAALGKPAGTRNSQRAAAAKANKQLQGVDKSDVEDTEVDDEPAPAKSQPIQKSKTTQAGKAKEQFQGDDQSDDDNVEVGRQIAPGRSENTQKGKTNTAQSNTKLKADKVKLAPEPDEKMSPLPQADETPDETSPSPAQNDTVDRVDADDLYDATPKKASQRSLPKELRGPEPTKISRASVGDKRNLTAEKEPILEDRRNEKVSNAPNKSTRNSGLDIASKLGDILGDLGDNPPETKDQKSVVCEELKQSAEPPKRKAGKANNEDNLTNTKSTKFVGSQVAALTSKPQNLVIWNVSDSPPAVAEAPEDGSVSSPVLKETSTVSHKQEKPRAADDEIFKKPLIPAYPKKTPIRSEVEAPSTTESELSEAVVDEEPDHDIRTSAISNKATTEAAQDTLMESDQEDLEIGDVGTKRKNKLAVTTPPKRRRVDENQNQPTEPSPVASLASSPPVRTKPSPKQIRKSRKSTETVTSPRRSPRLMNRTRHATEALQQAPSDAASAVKDPDRKPHLVSFGAHGALNQGISSTIKTIEDRLSSKDVTEEAVKPAGKNGPSTKHVAEAPKPAYRDIRDAKRKRERLEVEDSEILPNKRRSVSPQELAAMIESEYEDGDLPASQNSPPVKAIKTKSTRDRRSSKPPTRPSSQTSRVDKNGSPMASSQEDHIGKLRERLADQSRDPPSAPVESPVTVQPRRLSEVFGPRVVLEKKQKARMPSPQETAARYVAHEKTADGVYQEVTTRKVVVQEKKVHDPFAENGRKASGFTERLMSESSTGTRFEARTQREAFMSKKRNGEDAEPTLPKHTRGAPKSTHHPEPRHRTQNTRERTRVEIEPEASDPSMPSEMTMGTSYESKSSEADHMPPNEKPTASAVWNMAIRPHYTNLREAIHRIGDEVILRLQGEEDRMDLLVQQYKEEGSKILSKLEERHANERVAIVDALNQKRAEMVSVYSEAKEIVMDTVKDLKENSTAQFEREWRKRQDAIREDIAAGRKISEL